MFFSTQTILDLTKQFDQQKLWRPFFFAMSFGAKKKLQGWWNGLLQQDRQRLPLGDVLGYAQHPQGQGLTWRSHNEVLWVLLFYVILWLKHIESNYLLILFVDFFDIVWLNLKTLKKKVLVPYCFFFEIQYVKYLDIYCHGAVPLDMIWWKMHRNKYINDFESAFDLPVLCVAIQVANSGDQLVCFVNQAWWTNTAWHLVDKIESL